MGCTLQEIAKNTQPIGAVYAVNRVGEGEHLAETARLKQCFIPHQGFNETLQVVHIGINTPITVSAACIVVGYIEDGTVVVAKFRANRYAWVNRNRENT